MKKRLKQWCILGDKIDYWCIKHIWWFTGVAVVDLILGSILFYLKHQQQLK